MKSVDINQRIPLYILESLLYAFITDTYSDDYVLQQLRLEFNGENRLKKSLRIINKIIRSNPLSDFILENKQSLVPALKSENDRNIILISLLTSAFSFPHDLLSIMGKYFAVQDDINRELITKAISSIYGGNRATPNAIDSVVPMFLEAKLFNRPKPGIYHFEGPLHLKFSISGDFYIKSNEINGFRIDNNSPYFLFVKS